MVKIPDSIRPFWDFVAKYHFWLLAPLVPALVLPTLFMTNGKLSAEMAAKRSEIDGKISALKQVDGISPHPNDTWSSDMGKRANRVKQETFAEWQRFWESQAPLQVWPAEVGADFIQRIGALRPGRELPRPMLERYQSTVRDLARKLPERMGADVEMVDPDEVAAAGGGPPGLNAGAGGQGGMGMMMNRMRGGMSGDGSGVPMRRSNAIVEWSAADQQRVYDSFHWDKFPKTKQVVLAQEELNVYGLLCDQIAAINEGAGGSYNAAIPVVERIAVGYLAAEDDPAVSTAGRLFVPGADAAGGRMGMSMMTPGGQGGSTSMSMPGSPGAEGGGAVRPVHPRFIPKEESGGMKAMRMSMPPAGGPDGDGGAPAAAAEGPGTTDEAFLTWIYVDADGKPLKGEEVATSPSALMSHLMPFMIRATIDQRKLDTFLVQLATVENVPIDIRQVRINAPEAPTSGGGMMGMGMGMGMGRPPAGGPPGGGPMSPNRGMRMGRPPVMGGGDDSPMTGAGMASGGMMRPNDVVLEIRGTIALATRPDKSALGLEADGGDVAVDAADPEPAADANTPAAPAADVIPADDSPAAAADGGADGAAVPPAAPGEEGQPAAEPAPPGEQPAGQEPAGGDPAAPTDAPPAEPA